MRPGKETAMNRRTLVSVLAIALVLASVLAAPAQGQRRRDLPSTLLPFEVLESIILETSGELALQNEIFLAGVNRNRRPEEYVKGYFETRFLLERLKEYGIKDAAVLDLPSEDKETWDAESAELVMVQPEKRKIADLKEIAASLCSGSAPAEVTAELVYVGPGWRPEDYQGKKLKGRIALVNGSPGRAQKLAVEKQGAVGLVGFSSSHPEFDRDEVGWGWIDASEKAVPTFGFMVSQRTGQELRDELERGVKVVLKASVKARKVPFKEEMVEALLKGKDRPEEELVFTAHLYEGFAKQGANDDVSGCVAILETARTLKTLVEKGLVPPLRRSVRFLMVPEISGTSAYIKKYPEVARRFFANINEDMVGEALIKNNGYFVLERSPYSLPNCLGDVVESFVEWMGAAQRDSTETWGVPYPIYAPTGSRDPFYYAVGRYSGGSDHVVFIDGAVKVPAVMFICWPDMWYHTSGDLPDKSDATQLKRIGILGAAAALVLANAGPGDVDRIAGEVQGRALGRVGKERLRADRMIAEADAKGVAGAFKDAMNVVRQAVAREKDALATVRFFAAGDAAVEAALAKRVDAFGAVEAPFLKDLEGVYERRCAALKVKPDKPAPPTKDELRLAGLVPRRTAAMGSIMDFWRLGDKVRGRKDLPKYNLGRADFEARNFIDGKRSILDIRDAISAEYEPVAAAEVENYMKYLEILGMVEITKR
jgi:hypothetical protein